MPEHSIACADCGTEVAPGSLVCPGCHRLVHAARLKVLAAEADEAQRRGDPRSALVAWREALGFLPEASRQHEVVVSRIAELGRAVEILPAEDARSRRARASRRRGRAKLVLRASARSGFSSSSSSSWRSSCWPRPSS